MSHIAPTGTRSSGIRAAVRLGVTDLDHQVAPAPKSARAGEPGPAFIAHGTSEHLRLLRTLGAEMLAPLHHEDVTGAAGTLELAGIAEFDGCAEGFARRAELRLRQDDDGLGEFFAEEEH